MKSRVIGVKRHVSVNSQWIERYGLSGAENWGGRSAEPVRKYGRSHSHTAASVAVTASRYTRGPALRSTAESHLHSHQAEPPALTDNH